jgi:hypothetical protein
MEGTGIDHAHIKLVPMHGTENLKRGEWKQFLSGKEHFLISTRAGYHLQVVRKGDREKMKEVAKRIKESILSSHSS